MTTGLMMRRAIAGACFLLALLLGCPAWSQVDQSALTTVVVTASRVPEPINQTFFSTTVLTREDIEASQVQSMQDLLAYVAGIQVDNAGGLGQQSSVFMRGSDSDHTLLLIDGVRVGSATIGSAPWQIIPLEQIDHIEIVRGPMSTLYGSDAVGGVVQVFTRQADTPGMTLGASASTGSFDTQEFSGYLAARGDRAWASLSADVLTTAGITACLASAIAGCFDSNPPQLQDGFANRSGNLTAGVKVTDSLTVSANALYTHGWNAFDGDGFDDRLDFQEKVFSVNADQALGGGAWHVRLLAGRNVDDETDYLEATPVGTFNSSRDSATLQVDGKLTSALHLVSGLDYEDVSVDSDTAYTVTSRTTRAAFADLRADLGPWSLLGGARYEDNSQFGVHWTGNLGVNRKLGDNLRVVATWGTAFHAPSFDELYFPGFGNPFLRPETSRSYELGLDGNSGALRWSLHAYQNTIDNLIATDPETFLPSNINQARIRGIEAQADWHNRDWAIDAQLSPLQPLNTSPGPDYDNLLPRRAEQNGALTVRRLLPLALGGGSTASLGVAGRYQGRRYDDLANTLPMGGYFTADLLAQWTGRHFTLEARAANVLDRSYQTAAFYAQPGRNYTVTIRYRLQTK
jgi:vitamin B12 transporter